MTLKIAPTADGRRQRSERSQVAIVEAALMLISEEKQVPTAQQIADRKQCLVGRSKHFVR